MTQIAPIAPIRGASIINVLTPYNLFFTEGVLTNDEYALFWRGLHDGYTKIMDCKIHERGAIPTPEEVAIAAKVAQPTHICVPDALRNGHATIRMFLDYQYVLRDIDAELIAVPHGLSEDELCENAIELMKYTRFIGLNPGIKNELGLDRGLIAAKLHAVHPDAQFHMLGLAKLGRHGAHSLDFDAQDYIMGVDSARPIYQGVAGNHVVNRPTHYLEWDKWLLANNFNAIIQSINNWNGLLNVTTTE